MQNESIHKQSTLPPHIRAWEIVKGIAKVVAAPASLYVAFSYQIHFNTDRLINYLYMPLLALIATLCILSLDKKKKIRWWIVPVLFSALLWIQNLTTLIMVWDLSLDTQENQVILAKNILVITFQLLENASLSLILTKFSLWVRKKLDDKAIMFIICCFCVLCAYFSCPYR